MGLYRFQWIRPVATMLLAGSLPFFTAAQSLLVQPHQATLLLSKNHDRTTIRLVHDFPGFVRLRMVYEYFDGGHFVHRISAMWQGYHKVWSLAPLPAAATDLQFASLILEYGTPPQAFALHCRQDSAHCRLYVNGQLTDSGYVFIPKPLHLQDTTQAQFAAPFTPGKPLRNTQ